MSSAGSTGSSRVGSPRRKPSARVYRRRRQAAALLLLLLVGGLVWACIAVAGMFSRASEPVSAGSPTQTPQAVENTTAPVCGPTAIEVTGSTDAESYGAGQSPVLALTVSNTGDVACPLNVGTSQMEFLITSGSDRIFSSRDCQEGAEDLDVMLEPGASETARFTWGRNRSAPECAVVEEIPGPGQYVFQTRLGERVSEKVSFVLE